MKTIKKAFLLILVITFFIACSSDDESVPQITVPTVTYSDTVINAISFQEGNSSAPTINWNGNQGGFSLASAINGLSIDSNTGILSWTKELTLNTSTAQVIATNSAGQTSISITVNNPFQGVFSGGYNLDPLSTVLTVTEEYTFNSDGSFMNSSATTGTYTLSNTTINTDISSTSFTNYDELELSYTTTEVKLIGYWSATIQNPTQTNADGYTELTYVE